MHRRNIVETNPLVVVRELDGDEKDVAMRNILQRQLDKDRIENIAKKEKINFSSDAARDLFLKRVKWLDEWAPLSGTTGSTKSDDFTNHFLSCNKFVVDAKRLKIGALPENASNNAKPNMRTNGPERMSDYIRSLKSLAQWANEPLFSFMVKDIPREWWLDDKRLSSLKEELELEERRKGTKNAVDARERSRPDGHIGKNGAVRGGRRPNKPHL